MNFLLFIFFSQEFFFLWSQLSLVCLIAQISSVHMNVSGSDCNDSTNIIHGECQMKKPKMWFSCVSLLYVYWVWYNFCIYFFCRLFYEICEIKAKENQTVTQELQICSSNHTQYGKYIYEMSFCCCAALNGIGKRLCYAVCCIDINQIEPLKFVTLKDAFIHIHHRIFCHWRSIGIWKKKSCVLLFFTFDFALQKKKFLLSIGQFILSPEVCPA